MPDARQGPWLDDAAGPLIRPYTVSDGRTKPSTSFDLMTLVVATGAVGHGAVGPGQAEVLQACRRPVTVAEVAAHMRLPVAVVKVLLSDLLEHGAVTTRAFVPAPTERQAMDIELLEAVLHGLRKRL